MELTTSADGTAIAYERFGSGPAVVLVGGALCDRASTRPLAEELGRLGVTAVTYDRRGRGDSGDAHPYGVDREVQDVAALIEAVGGPVMLYGHSSGAALALHAAGAGLPLTGLVLHEAPFNLDDHQSEEVTRSYRQQLDALLGAERYDEATELFMRTVGLPDDAIAGMRAEPWWPGTVALAPTLLHDSEVMGDREGGTVPSDLLGRVAAPTLVLYGGDSPPWMLEVAHRLVGGLADARLRTLEGEEHVVAPEVLAPVLEGFVASRAERR